MTSTKVSFSIAGHSAWAPGLDTPEAWLAWTDEPFKIVSGPEPGLRAMPPMLRRRAGPLGKMALEAAYQGIGQHKNIPVVFCSRHGEVSRSFDMLSDLAKGEPLSPASFGLSVHNAIAGLFSIARSEQANNISLAGGQSSVETAVIEACGLLADGEQTVLLVVYDCPLPSPYEPFQDAEEQPYAWAWLMESPGTDAVSLEWSANDPASPAEDSAGGLPHGLEIYRSFLRGDIALERICGKQNWTWSWHA